MDSSKRSFTVESIDNKKVKSGNGGRYISSTPSSAAKKAYSQFASSAKKQLVICVRETTQGSAKKCFKYKVSRRKQNNEVNINGQPILFKYKIVTKAM
jgi:hypothetical protein